MAAFRDTTVSRRGLAAVGALAATMAPAMGTTPMSSLVLRQARRVAALYEAEGEACIAFSRLEGQEGEDAAQEVVQAAYDEWEAAAFTMAEMPAKNLCDFLAKLAVVFQALRSGPGEAESAVAAGLLRDLWHLAPDLRPLLRWSPVRPGFLA
jgi:hypothetical protein